MSESELSIPMDMNDGYCNDLQKHGRLHMEDWESMSTFDE